MYYLYVLPLPGQVMRDILISLCLSSCMSAFLNMLVTCDNYIKNSCLSEYLYAPLYKHVIKIISKLLTFP